MTKPVSDKMVGSIPAARGVGLPGSLERRIEELAREERTAVAGGDWATATNKALEKVRLREAHHWAGTRRRP